MFCWKIFGKKFSNAFRSKIRLVCKKTTCKRDEREYFSCQSVLIFFNDYIARISDLFVAEGYFEQKITINKRHESLGQLTFCRNCLFSDYEIGIDRYVFSTEPSSYSTCLNIIDL